MVQKLEFNHMDASQLAGTPIPQRLIPSPEIADLKLHPDPTDGLNLVSSYTESSITVNGQVWQTHVVLPTRGPVMPWPVGGFDALSPNDFASLSALEPELVIFGSGPRLRFVHPAQLQALMQRRIGLETMDTPAACRTYNILAAEGRRVVAALLLASTAAR